MAGGNCNRPLGQRNDRPEVEVSIAPLGLPGTLVHPAAGQGVVLFAHGSGSSRLSPRNRLVAERLQRSGLGTLLFDLLHPEEASNRRNVLNRLSEGLIGNTRPENAKSPGSLQGFGCGRFLTPGLHQARSLSPRRLSSCSVLSRRQFTLTRLWPRCPRSLDRNCAAGFHARSRFGTHVVSRVCL